MEKILHFGKHVIVYSSFVLIGVLFIISVFSTAYFDPKNMGAEHPLYRMDNPFLFILFAAVFIAVVYLLDKKLGLEKIPDKLLFTGAMAYTLFLGVYWVSAGGVCPDADQMSVSFIASLTAQNNFLFFEPEKYMQIYPNQLGMVAFLELIYRIVGGENFQIFQYINAVANCFVIAALYAIVSIIFKKKRITNIFLILSFGCVHLILYSTFVYGVTMGLAFALWSVFLALYFMERKKWMAAVGSGICMAIAILFKNNYSIFLVALVLLLLYKAMENKRFEYVILILLLLLTWKGAEGVLISHYEQRSGIELSDGMPKIMWIAMGMQEGDRAEGWYNAFNYDTFRETGCDAEESAKIAKNAIKKTAIAFFEKPGYAVKFYFKKFVSQWNEPTYASIWVNIFHQGDFSVLIQSFYDGKLNGAAVEYMNLYQSLILLGAVTVLICNRKKWKEEQLILFLILLGGFFFHMLWEAKSQYIMPYFILLIPYAAAGMDSMCDKIDIFYRRKRT